MSSKIKWKESFQKARSQSQGSFDEKNGQRKTSLLDEGDLSVSDDELEEYLGTLKKKSGVARLWTGNAFDKIIDRTPDVSISSVSDGEGPTSAGDKNPEGDQDFLPNVLALPSASEAFDDRSQESEPSSIKPLQAINMISDLKLLEDPGELANNVKMAMSYGDADDLPVTGYVKSENSDVQSEAVEPHTLDEVSEVIEELHSRNSGSAVQSISSILSGNSIRTQHSTSQGHSSRHSSKHSLPGEKGEYSCQASSRSRSHRQHKNSSHYRSGSSKSSGKAMSYVESDHTYTSDFYDSNKESTLQKSQSYTSSDSSLSADGKSLDKSLRKRRNNQAHRDVAIQVSMADLGKNQRLGIGMATLGPSFGNQYVDPSPIAPHVVNADAVEALTAHNPAVVALTDMLRQQLKLLEQFVDNSRRMYESYTSNLNTTYQYTTLEDTKKYIEENRVDLRRRRLKEKSRSNEDG